MSPSLFAEGVGGAFTLRAEGSFGHWYASGDSHPACTFCMMEASTLEKEAMPLTSIESRRAPARIKVTNFGSESPESRQMRSLVPILNVFQVYSSDCSGQSANLTSKHDSRASERKADPISSTPCGQNSGELKSRTGYQNYEESHRTVLEFAVATTLCPEWFFRDKVGILTAFSDVMTVLRISRDNFAVRVPSISRVTKHQTGMPWLLNRFG